MMDSTAQFLVFREQESTDFGALRYAPGLAVVRPRFRSGPLFWLLLPIQTGAIVFGFGFEFGGASVVSMPFQ